jgi:AcrR family transcriptional regulator
MVKNHPTEKPVAALSQTARKHADILRAATRLFAQQGVAQTTTRDIAAAAVTTERTLFKHFGSKEALTRAVVDEAVLPHVVATSLADLRAAITAHKGDVTAWHRSVLSTRTKAIGETPDLTRLLLVEILRDESVRVRFAEAWTAAAWVPLVGAFRQLQKSANLRRDIKPETLARVFLSMNIGYLVARFVLAEHLKWDDAQETAAIAKLFYNGAAAG